MKLVDFADMPINWLAYTNLDVVVVAWPYLDQIASTDPQRIEALRRWTHAGGTLLVLEHDSAIHVWKAGEVYARDEFVYWGFSGASLARLAEHAGFARLEIIDTPMIDGHPRITGMLLAEE